MHWKNLKLRTKILAEIPADLVNAEGDREAPQATEEERDQLASKAFSNIMNILGD